MKKVAIGKIAAAAVTAAAYAALTMLLAPVSYGPLQFRVSEALCVLPAFLPSASWGLAAGCAAANLISSAGIPDVVFGSAATLAAALCAGSIGKKRPLSLGRSAAVCLMPAVWNAPVIGILQAWVSVSADIFWPTAALFAAQIAAGELAVMMLLGLPLLRFLSRSAPFCGLVDKVERGW